MSSPSNVSFTSLDPATLYNAAIRKYENYECTFDDLVTYSMRISAHLAAKRVADPGITSYFSSSFMKLVRTREAVYHNSYNGAASKSVSCNSDVSSANHEDIPMVTPDRLSAPEVNDLALRVTNDTNVVNNSMSRESSTSAVNAIAMTSDNLSRDANQLVVVSKSETVINDQSRSSNELLEVDTDVSLDMDVISKHKGSVLNIKLINNITNDSIDVVYDQNLCLNDARDVHSDSDSSIDMSKRSLKALALDPKNNESISFVARPSGLKNPISVLINKNSCRIRMATSENVVKDQRVDRTSNARSSLNDSGDTLLSKEEPIRKEKERIANDCKQVHSTLVDNQTSDMCSTFTDAKKFSGIVHLSIPAESTFSNPIKFLVNQYVRFHHHSTKMTLLSCEVPITSYIVISNQTRFTKTLIKVYTHAQAYTLLDPFNMMMSYYKHNLILNKMLLELVKMHEKAVIQYDDDNTLRRRLKNRDYESRVQPIVIDRHLRLLTTFHFPDDLQIPVRHNYTVYDHTSLQLGGFDNPLFHVDGYSVDMNYGNLSSNCIQDVFDMNYRVVNRLRCV